MNRIICADVIAGLRELPDASVQCVVTSPPYWGLRDYGVTGQIGSEETVEQWVARMVEVFREVRRVLRPDGTVWLNLGDSYVSGARGPIGDKSTLQGSKDHPSATRFEGRPTYRRDAAPVMAGQHKAVEGLKTKDLVGQPWRVAFALQADGWWLRSDIVWHKPNPMPESVEDRPTKAHEYLFLLAKSERYYYDGDAIREAHAASTLAAHANGRPNARAYGSSGHQDAGGKVATGGWGRTAEENEQGRFIDPRGANKRTVWTIATEAYPEAHFATFPTALVKPCILAGTSAVGACPTCGAPFKRLVETVSVGKVDYEGKRAETEPQASGRRMLAGVRAARLAGGPHDNPFPPRETVGWCPSCDCYTRAKRPDLMPAEHDHPKAPKPRPCLVLDPFAGSGTTLAVAQSLARDYVGVELNPQYVELARQRLSTTDVGLPLGV